MSKDIYDKLPQDTIDAIESGAAVIKVKFGSFCVVDEDMGDLFDILPLISQRWGFALSIPTKDKVYNTYFSEIVCKQRGKVTYKNNCRLDLRECNLEVEPWEEFNINKESARKTNRLSSPTKLKIAAEQ